MPRRIWNWSPEHTVLLEQEDRLAGDIGPPRPYAKRSAPSGPSNPWASGLVRRNGGEARGPCEALHRRAGDAANARRRARGVAFVENEVDDLQHGSEPLREFLAARGFVNQAPIPKSVRLARTRRWAIVASGCRKARAISLGGPGRRSSAMRAPRRGLARQQRMTGGEDQPKQFVADVVVQRQVPIRACPCCSCSMSEASISCLAARAFWPRRKWSRGPALGGRHQPCPGFLGNAGRGPVLERGQQRFPEVKVFGQRHIAQHPRQACDQPRLLESAIRSGSCDGCRRPSWPPAGFYLTLASGVGERLDLTTRLHGPAWRTSEPSHVPSQPGMWSLWSCMNSTRGGHGLLPCPAARRSRSRRLPPFRLHERAIDDPELSVRDPHLGTRGDRHQPRRCRSCGQP